jgi:predicted GIY-YIG superfamily endonuclease
MVYGHIYKIPFPNGKFYIGLTTRTLEERYKEHKREAVRTERTNKTKMVHDAIRKYDMIDTFELVEVDTAETMEELCRKETEQINHHNSYYKNNGYNMTFGGEGNNGYVFTEKDRLKLSASQKKRFEDPEAIKKISDAQRKYHTDNPGARVKLSEAQKKFHADNPKAGQLHSERMKKRFEDNPDLGKRHSEKMKKRFKDDPELGRLHSERMKKRYEDNPELGRQFSERMKRHFEDNPGLQSERLKRYFEDPAARKKNGDAVKKYYEDNPGARQECSERMKRNYEDNPGLSRLQSERLKRYFEDPAARKKNGDAVKKHYEDNPGARQECSERMKKYFEENPEARKKGMPKPFDVFDKDGTYIKSFDYQFQAKEYLQEICGINGRNVLTNAVLNGKRKSSQGFIFRYQVQFWV